MSDRLKNNRCSLLFASLLFIAEPAKAFDWTASNLQLLYGSNFELGTSDRATLTVEHGHGWKYGTNFFFADMVNRRDIGFEIYAEVYTYLSFEKITGMDWSLGPVRDFALLGGLNISNRPEERNFKAYLFGVSLDLSNAYIEHLQLDVAAYKNDSVSGKYGIQLTPVWSFPFGVGPLKFRFRGYMDIRSGNTNAHGNFHLLAQPQFLFDVGHLAGWKTDKIYVGTEYSYWLNKFGINGVNESAFQAMIIGFF